MEQLCRRVSAWVVACVCVRARACVCACVCVCVCVCVMRATHCTRDTGMRLHLSIACLLILYQLGWMMITVNGQSTHPLIGIEGERKGIQVWLAPCMRECEA